MYTRGFLTIDEVVMDLQYRGQDYSMTNYDYWFHLAIKAIQKMNIFNLRTSIVAYLAATDTGVIKLPDDYIDYVQIGYVDFAGVFHTLSLDSNLFPVPHETCGVDDTRLLHAQNQLPPLFNFPGPFVLWGSYLATPYGLTGGYNVGYYNINRMTNELYTTLPAGTAVCVEYKTSGVSQNNVTMVRQQMQEAIISWCMMTAQKHNVIQSQTNWATVYYGDENELESLDQAITQSEFQDILYGTWKQTPKR